MTASVGIEASATSSGRTPRSRTARRPSARRSPRRCGASHATSDPPTAVPTTAPEQAERQRLERDHADQPPRRRAEREQHAELVRALVGRHQHRVGDAGRRGDEDQQTGRRSRPFRRSSRMSTISGASACQSSTSAPASSGSFASRRGERLRPVRGSLAYTTISCASSGIANSWRAASSGISTPSRLTKSTGVVTSAATVKSRWPSNRRRPGRRWRWRRRALTRICVGQQAAHQHLAGRRRRGAGEQSIRPGFGRHVHAHDEDGESLHRPRPRAPARRRAPRRRSTPGCRRSALERARGVGQRAIHRARVAPLGRVRLHVAQHRSGDGLDQPVGVAAQHAVVEQHERHRQTDGAASASAVRRRLRHRLRHAIRQVVTAARRSCRARGARD